MFGCHGKYHFPENDFQLITIFTFDPEIIYSPHFHFKSLPERERERERREERAQIRERERATERKNSANKRESEPEKERSAPITKRTKRRLASVLNADQRRTER